MCCKLMPIILHDVIVMSYKYELSWQKPFLPFRTVSHRFDTLYFDVGTVCMQALLHHSNVKILTSLV